MKFHSLVDNQTFLIEVGKLNEALELKEVREPTDEEMQSFIAKRKPLEGSIKSHRKSVEQKNNWRKNRFKMMKGIKAFHKSTDGKRMHRKVGRLVATRVTRDKNRTSRADERWEGLSAVNTLKQHLIIELGYFHSLYEQIEIEEMVLDSAMPMLTEIEKKILNDEELNTDELTLLLDMVDQDVLLDELSKVTGESFENLKKWCEDIENDLTAKGLTKDDPDFVVEVMKCLVLSANEVKKF